MAKANLGDLIGGWAFLIGVVLALVVGIFQTTNTSNVQIALVIIGIIIGLLNVGDKEVTPFLLSGLVLVLVARFGVDALAKLPVAVSILAAFMMIFVPATIIVAVKNVFSLAKR